jgi:hypothetical protein
MKTRKVLHPPSEIEIIRELDHLTRGYPGLPDDQDSLKAMMRDYQAETGYDLKAETEATLKAMRKLRNAINAHRQKRLRYYETERELNLDPTLTYTVIERTDAQWRRHEADREAAEAEDFEREVERDHEEPLALVA